MSDDHSAAISDPGRAAPAATTAPALADVLARLDAIAGILTNLLNAGSGIRPEAVDAAQAAVIAGVSISKWRQMDADGLCPSPIQLGTGRCPRWLYGEILCWLKAGAPSRARWSAMREAAMRRCA